MKKLILTLLLVISFNSFSNEPVKIQVLNKTLLSYILTIPGMNAGSLNYTKDAQTILKSKYVIATPHYTDPEVSDLVKLREDEGLETLRVYLPSNLIKWFKVEGKNPVEELSHFWLYPAVSCHMKNQIIDYINKTQRGIKRVECGDQEKLFQSFRMTLAKLRPLKISVHSQKYLPLFKTVKNVAVNIEKNDTMNLTIHRNGQATSLSLSENQFNHFSEIFEFLKQQGS
jgi:hypothetical protein